MIELGTGQQDAQRTVSLFQERDEILLVESHGFYDDEKQSIQTTRQVTQELQSLLEADSAGAAH